jgi:hypothetical protein
MRPTELIPGLSLVALLAAATGCSGSVDAPGTEPAPMAGTISIQGVTRASDGTVLPGVSVCLGSVWWSPTPTHTCVWSGADGAFQLPGAGVDQSTTVWFQKNGYLPVLRAIQTQQADIALPPTDNVLARTDATFMGVKPDSAKGSIEFNVDAPGLNLAPTMSVTTTATDGSLLAPVYVDAKGGPVSGASTGTRGAFVNLEPGFYVVRFGDPSVSCHADGLSGYPVSSPSEGVFVPVVAGSVTAPVTVTCTAR